MKIYVARTLPERDRIYIQILDAGIVAIRNASLDGIIPYCQVESEHLHNIPSLIGETNEKRHDFYLDGEKKPPGVTLSPWAIGRSPSTGIFPSV